MRMTSRLGRVVLPLLLMTGCSGEPASPPVQPTPTKSPFPGWVPAPSGAQNELAACLSGHGVRISKTLGRFLITGTAAPAVTAARQACQEQESDFLSTMSDSRRVIPDEAGHSFVVEVRSCMVRLGQTPVLETDLVLLTAQLTGARYAAFEACVTEIRARPTPTD